MPKKARTPPPPRKVQAPQRRVEHKQRGPRPGRPPVQGKYLAIGGAAIVLAVGGILGGVLGSRGGGGSSGHLGAPPDATGVAVPHMEKLPGIQLGKPPWPPESSKLAKRLDVINVASSPGETLAVHEHMHLDIYDDGKAVEVPAQIGFDFKNQTLTPLHTHDPSGVIHKEAPSAYDFTLGQFFAIWGVRLSKTCIGGLCAKPGKPLRFLVNGHPFSGDPTKLVLRKHDEFVIAYGKPPKKIPTSYHFQNGL